MALLEAITHLVHDAYFVDLFVRCSNQVAIKVRAAVAACVHLCVW